MTDTLGIDQLSKNLKNRITEDELIQFVQDVQKQIVQTWLQKVQQNAKQQGLSDKQEEFTQYSQLSQELVFLPLPVFDSQLNLITSTKSSQYKQLQENIYKSHQEDLDVQNFQEYLSRYNKTSIKDPTSMDVDNQQTLQDLQKILQDQQITQKNSQQQLSIQKAPYQHPSQENNLQKLLDESLNRHNSENLEQQSQDPNIATDLQGYTFEQGLSSRKKRPKVQPESTVSSDQQDYVPHKSLVKSKRKLSFDNLQKANQKQYPFSPDHTQVMQRNNQNMQPAASLYDVSQFQEGSSHKQRIGKLHLVSFQNEQLLVNGNEVAELKPFGKLVRIGDKVGELCWGLVTNQRGKPLFPNVIIKCNCGCKQILSPQKFSKHANKQYYGKNLMDKIKLVKGNKSLGQWLNENWPQGITNEGFQSFQGQQYVTEQDNINQSELNTDINTEDNESVDNQLYQEESSPVVKEEFQGHQGLQSGGSTINARTQQMIQSIITSQDMKLVLSRPIAREQASSFYTILSQEEIFQLVGEVDFSVDHYLRVTAKTLNTNEEIQCCISVYGKDGQQRQNQQLGNHARFHLRSRNSRTYLQNMKCQPGDVFQVFKDRDNNFFVNIQRSESAQQINGEETKATPLAKQQHAKSSRNATQGVMDPQLGYRSPQNQVNNFMPQNMMQGQQQLNMQEILRNLVTGNNNISDNQQQYNTFGSQYLQNQAILNLLNSQRQNLNRQQPMQNYQIFHGQIPPQQNNDLQQLIADANKMPNNQQNQMEMQQIMQLLQTQEGQQSVIQELQKQNV